MPDGTTTLGLLVRDTVLSKWKSLSRVQPYNPWNSPGQNTGVGSLSLLQAIFPTQESNQGLLHRRQILYQLSYQTLHWPKKITLLNATSGGREVVPGHSRRREAWSVKRRGTLLNLVWTTAANGARRSWRLRMHIVFTCIPCVHPVPFWFCSPHTSWP